MAEFRQVAIDNTISATAGKVAATGGAAAVIGGLTANEIAAYGGLMIGAIAAVVQLVFRWLEFRERRAYYREMRAQGRAPEGRAPE